MLRRLWLPICGRSLMPYGRRSPPQALVTICFRCFPPQQVRAAGPDMVRLVGTEVAREAATLLMLGAVAAAVGGNFRQWFAFFLLAFGAWDISYYAFLKVLIDWPKSLLTWDVLFLIPVPWSGPVLAPALVALTMVGTGLRLSVAGIKRSFDSAEGSSLALRLRGRVVYPGRLYLGLPQRHGWRHAEALQLATICSRRSALGDGVSALAERRRLVKSRQNGHSSVGVGHNPCPDAIRRR